MGVAKGEKYYHGSPVFGLEELCSGSWVSPELAIAELMGRYHLDTGKTWDNDDLTEPHYLGRDPKWKSGREPMGLAHIYEVRADDVDVDFLDNPYEHQIRRVLAVTPLG